MIAKPRTSNPQRSSPHTTYPATTSTAASMVSLDGLGISRECHALFRTDVTIIQISNTSCHERFPAKSLCVG